MEDFKSHLESDPHYEFAAPKFHDFLTDNIFAREDNADSWFDNRRLTNASAFNFGKTSTQFEAKKKNPLASFKNTIRKALSKDLTVPLSPKFAKRARTQEEENKENKRESAESKESKKKEKKEKKENKQESQENIEIKRKTTFLPSSEDSPSATKKDSGSDVSAHEKIKGSLEKAKERKIKKEKREKEKEKERKERKERKEKKIPADLPIPQSPVISKKTRSQSHSGVTIPEPFSFLGQQISTQKRKRLEEEKEKTAQKEKKAREFKAQPLYSDSPERLPKVERKEVTLPEPFELQVDLRGQIYQRAFTEMVEREEVERIHKFCQFKAKDPEVLNKAPFVPKKSEKPLTEMGDTFLYTEERAKERKKFDLHLKEKEKLEKRLEEQRRIQEEEREKREIQALRKRLVHQAQPIVSYPPLSLRPSAKRPTVPQSPLIGQKRKKLVKA